MEQTQLAPAGAAGITTTLFRAPYSSQTGAIGDYSRPVYKKLGRDGCTSVFVDTDSDDWKQPGASKIVRWAAPKKDKGASVLFHDAGGDRSQTIEGLPATAAHLPLGSQWFLSVVGRVLIAVFVLLCGWVEDAAARKKPRLMPGGGPARMGP